MKEPDDRAEKRRGYDEEDRYAFDLAPWMISWEDGTVRFSEDGEPYFWIETIEFSTPDFIDEPQYKRPVILLIDSRHTRYNKCPHCKASIPHPTVLIVLEYHHIFPCIMCEMMVWMNNEPHLRMGSGACDEVKE